MGLFVHTFHFSEIRFKMGLFGHAFYFFHHLDSVMKG
jgi:hypothetical protein